MEIHTDLGNTVIMITHDVDEAVLLSDRIVMMTNGPVATIGEILTMDLPRSRNRVELSDDVGYYHYRSKCCNSSMNFSVGRARRTQYTSQNRTRIFHQPSVLSNQKQLDKKDYTGISYSKQSEELFKPSPIGCSLSWDGVYRAGRLRQPAFYPHASGAVKLVSHISGAHI